LNRGQDEAFNDSHSNFMQNITKEERGRRNDDDQKHQRSKSELQTRQKKSWVFSLFKGKKQKPVIPSLGSGSKAPDNTLKNQEYYQNIMYTQPDEPPSDIKNNNVSSLFRENQKEDNHDSDNLSSYMKRSERETKQEKNLQGENTNILGENLRNDDLQKQQNHYNLEERIFEKENQTEMGVTEDFLQNQNTGTHSSIQENPNFEIHNEPKMFKEKLRASSVPSQKVLTNNWQFQEPSRNQDVKIDETNFSFIESNKNSENIFLKESNSFIQNTENSTKCNCLITY